MATQSTDIPSAISHHPHLDDELIFNAYSLVATQDSDQFRNLYGLGDCGANLEEVIFEFGEMDFFFTFSLPQNVQHQREEAHRLLSLQPSSSGNRNCYVGAKFGVIARPLDKSPVLFFGFCDCPTCKQSVDIDPIQLQSITVACQFNFGGWPYSVRGCFCPTCKEDYNMGSPLSRNLQSVLYYLTDWNSDMRNFIAHLRSIRVPGRSGVADITTTIMIKSIAQAHANNLEESDSTLGLMLEEHAFADFKLVSIDNERIQFNCHKSVLSVQSDKLKRILLRMQRMKGPLESKNTLTLAEDGKTIRAFLEWIYSKSESPISSSFEVASGLLRLGHEFKLPKLIAAAAQVLTQKVKKDTPAWNISTALWRLYKFVRLVNKIDVVVRLKIAIVTMLAKTMAKKKLEKVRDSATEELTALNGGEPVDPVVANDFIMDALDVGKFD